jgi:hypothetical protein
MFSYYMQSALASERRKAFLAEMDAARRVRQARSGRRADAYAAGRSPLRLLAGWLPSVSNRWRAGRSPQAVQYEIGLVAEADPRPAGCQEGQARRAAAA